MAFEVTGIQVAIRGDSAVTDARRLDSALDRLGQTGTQTEGRFSRLARSTTTMGGAFDRLRQSVFSLQGAFGALGIGLTARELINMADASTQINNRLKLVTSTTEELVAVEERLFEVSQRAGVSFKETVSLYARLTTSSQDLNLSQEQLFKITESINQSIAITGDNSASAAAGLFQLSQALAAGQLRGDELNSVLEQTPRLAKAIADGLNAPVGQLRILAEQGELTAERVIQALLSQSDVIEREFNKTTLTVGQSFTQLSNAAIRAIGNINENIGGTQILSASMRVLATHMETVLKLIGILATAGLAATMSRFATATLSAAGAFNALAVAMARNPFGLIAVGIATVTSALTLFKDEHITLMGVTTELGDFTNAAWTEINNIIRSNSDEAVSAAKSSFSDLVNAVGLSGADIITVYTTTTNAIPKLWKNSTNLQLAILVGFSQAVTSLTKSIVESYANAFDNIKNIATSFFSSIQDFFAGRDMTFGAFRAALNETFVEPTIEAGRQAREAFTEAFQIDYIGELSGRAVETANSAISSINTSLEGFGERVAATARETKIARLQTQAFTELMSGELNPAVESSNAIFEDLRGLLDQLSKGAKSSATATKNFADTFKSLREQLDPVVRAEREFQESTALLNRALKEGKVSLEEYNKLLGLILENYNEIAGGGEKVAKGIDKASRSAKTLAEEADPVARVWEDAASRINSTFTDTFRSILDEGIDGFKDLGSRVLGIFKDILAQMATLALARPVIVPIVSAMGGVMGVGQQAQAGIINQLGGFGGFGGFGAGPTTVGANPISPMAAGAGYPGGGAATAGAFSSVGSVAFSGLQGAGVGYLSSSLTGGNAVGGSIGGAIGGIAGSAFGPIGTIVGGAIGGALGGAIGNMFSSNDFKASIGTALDRSSPALRGTASDVIRESAFGNVGFAQSRDFSSRDAQEFIDSIVEIDNVLAASLLPEQIDNVRRALDGFVGSVRKGTGNIDQVKERLTVIFRAIDADAARMAQSFAGLPIEDMIEGFISLNQVSKFLKADPFADFTESLLIGTRTLYQQALISRRELIDLARAFDGSLDAAHELAAATQSRYQLELALLQQIDSVARGITVSFSDTKNQIIESTLSQEQLYDRLSTRAEELARQMRTAIDPQIIGELAAQINQLTGRAFGLLDEEQKQSSAGGFLDFLSGVERLAGSRLDASRQTIEVDRNAGLTGTVASELSRVINGFSAQQQRLMNLQEMAAIAQREAAVAARLAAEAQARAALDRSNFYSGMGGR